jgi:hypothetical protein
MLFYGFLTPGSLISSWICIWFFFKSAMTIFIVSWSLSIYLCLVFKTFCHNICHLNHFRVWFSDINYIHSVIQPSSLFQNIILNRYSVPLSDNSQVPCFLQPLITTNLLSILKNWHIISMSYKLNHIILSRFVCVMPCEQLCPLFFIMVFFGSSRIWTQGLKLLRLVLYHLSHSSSPCFLLIIFLHIIPLYASNMFCLSIHLFVDTFGYCG